MTATSPSLPRVSPAMLRWFIWYTRRYAGKHLHSIRVHPAVGINASGPIVVYVNHPSWWDPIVCLQLAALLFPLRRHYAPMHTEALKRYRFFSRLGFFPAQSDSYSGARQFLNHAAAVLSVPDAVLWVTAQGRFADVRERPVKLLPGIAHLARSHQFTAIPLALEYRMGVERAADAYARLGKPFASTSDLTTLQMELEGCMDRLSTDVISGVADQYVPLLTGAAGTGGAYEVWQRMRARLSRKTYDAEHGSLLHRGEA